MLMPKRVKHRKQFRGRMKGKAQRGNVLAYGEYGLQAMEPHWVTSQQIEAARIALTRYTKRGGQVWIKIFPDKPVTAKPAETRMGSGKGAPEYWVAVVKPGRVLFEIAGVPEDVAREALRLASHKLPLKTKLIIKANEEAKAAEKAPVSEKAAEEDLKEKVEAKVEEIKADVEAKAEEVKAKAETVKAEAEVKAEEIKADAKEAKAKVKAKAEEVKAEVEAKAEEVKAEVETKAEEIKADAKEAKAKVKAKAEEVKAEVEAKVKAKAEKKEETEAGGEEA